VGSYNLVDSRQRESATWTNGELPDTYALIVTEENCGDLPHAVCSVSVIFRDSQKLKVLNFSFWESKACQNGQSLACAF